MRVIHYYLYTLDNSSAHQKHVSKTKSVCSFIETIVMMMIILTVIIIITVCFVLNLNRIVSFNVKLLTSSLLSAGLFKL